jgi:transposase
MPSVTAPADREQIVIGVDTHKDTHVAVALTAQGAFVDTLNFASTSLGIGQVMRWAAGLGEVTAWGVEGTGSYGAGLARALLAAGRPVIDVNHANRAARHVLGGKTDRIDAEAAARSVLTDYATAIPKTGDGPVELLRITRGARSSAVKARTAAMNQLRAVLVTAPPTLRDQLSALSPAALIDRCCPRTTSYVVSVRPDV